MSSVTRKASGAFGSHRSGVPRRRSYGSTRSVTAGRYRGERTDLPPVGRLHPLESGSSSAISGQDVAGPIRGGARAVLAAHSGSHARRLHGTGKPRTAPALGTASPSGLGGRLEHLTQRERYFRAVREDDRICRVDGRWSTVVSDGPLRNHVHVNAVLQPTRSCGSPTRGNGQTSRQLPSPRIGDDTGAQVDGHAPGTPVRRGRLVLRPDP